MRGVVYVAYGAPARREAGYSIESLRRYHDWPVTVIGERVAEAAHIPEPRQDHGGRWAKVRLDTLSPYDETLYLDADTRVHAPIELGFDLLADGWDMVLTASECQGSDWLGHVEAEERDATRAELRTDLLQLQAGVFWFAKNARTAALFAVWREEWQRWGANDQGALLRAINKAPIKLWLLGRHWNTGRRDPIIEHRFGMARER